MINITLVDNSGLEVRLSADLKEYCEAYKNLCEQRKILKSLQDMMQHSLFGSNLEITSAEEKVATAQDKFNKIRTEFVRCLKGANGNQHWYEVKRLLSTRCDCTNPIENRLHRFLTDANGESGNFPLAIEVLNLRFIELLKNSLDAILTNYLHNYFTNDVNTKLDMRVSFHVTDKNLSVVITDNAGGFPADFLTNFNQSGYNRDFCKISSHEKYRLREYTFGGAGKGLEVLINYVTKGILVNRISAKRIFSVKKDDTAVKIQNTSDGKGAEITIMTPFDPYIPLSDSTISIAAIEADPLNGIAQEELNDTKEVLLSAPPRKLRKTHQPSIFIPVSKSDPDESLPTETHTTSGQRISR